MAAPSDPNIPKSFLVKYLEEDCYPEELRESIISLPKHKGWLVPNIYKYRGFWLEPIHLHGLLRFQQHFQAQDSDIMLCSQPKCGTTWLKALTFAIVTRKQFLVPQETTHSLLTKNPHELIPGIEHSYATENSPDFSLINGVRILSTHLPCSLLPESVWESKCKMIYVCRNPKDALVSLWHFINKLRGELRGLGAIPFPEAFHNYCRGVCDYGPHWDHVLGYWKQSSENPRKVLFLKYEEIKEAPDVQLRRMAEFLGCPFSEEEEECGVVSGILKLCSFQSLSNLEVNKTSKSSRWFSNNVFFRKGEVGDWRNHLTEEMAIRLDLIVEEKFKGTGLNF